MKNFLLKRLGNDSSVVDYKALVFASQKIAERGGDARALLHIISEAIAKASKGRAIEGNEYHCQCLKAASCYESIGWRKGLND